MQVICRAVVVSKTCSGWCFQVPVIPSDIIYSAFTNWIAGKLNLGGKHGQCPKGFCWCCNSPRTLKAPVRNDLWGIESAGNDASISNTSLQYGFMDHAMCLIWEIQYLNIWSCCLKCVSPVQEEEKLIQSELASIKEQVSSPNTSMVWFLRLFPFGVVVQDQSDYSGQCLKLLLTSSDRGRWRSSWWERSTVKCSAMMRRSVIFMPLNWLNKAVPWRKELVCSLAIKWKTVLSHSLLF